MSAHPAFRCIVASPLGKLLDCMATSVIFPAHDGKVGIWYNHIPMLCKLDVGIMKITGIPQDVDTPPEIASLSIDGGFALLAANVLTIITADSRVEKTEKSAAGT